MFFLTTARPEEDVEPRTGSLRMFGKVIETIDSLRFPKFSNDCEYLVILNASDLLSNLGSRTDDHANYFTARMLMLLESQCLFGDEIYENVLASVVESYFRDFPKHQETFTPVFLLNDICRYWKTLLLNYENKRGFAIDSPEAEVKKIKQKVRNFKLKFSRLTTCYASVAALGSFLAPVTQAQIIEIAHKPPRDRLIDVGDRIPNVKAAIADLLEQYDWFLEQTGLSTADLEEKFSDEPKRADMFIRAKIYGDSMYRLISAIDATDSRLRLVRNLAI